MKTKDKKSIPDPEQEAKTKIKDALKYTQQNIACLSESGARFIMSLKKSYARNKMLSERQQKALFEIRNNISVEANA